ncbi:ABC transporter permease [candidate division WWE3 bacterium]|uniref:ABC transporter permease n=1 Tax=candidate division WWE3 bacterium TaxID=2053526 RepID=A0A955LJT2_UNCKA|nr:ABC transporter permease [candidate division WWE3 bacterium]
MIANIRSALNSIWSNKVRSVLTLLGVVIGVSSVTTLISLGQGLKDETSSLIQGFGTNVVVIIGGKIDTTQGFSGGGGTNPANFVSGDILTQGDIASIEKLDGVEQAAPITLVPGSVSHEDKVTTPIIFGTTPNLPETFLILSLEDGRMFDPTSDEQTVVIGDLTSTQLFDGQNPIGRNVKINGKEYQVVGKLGKAKLSSLFGSEYDNIVLIPFDLATEINKGRESISRIIVKADDDADVQAVKENIFNTILQNHEGEEDFSVLTQDDLLGLLSDVLNLSTALVSAIAAISLVVGGIGIMNIMLVTVTERTREIGLRKAVGATKLAILIQFLVESIVITLLGGLIGLGISFAIGFVVDHQTPLTPTFSPQIILLAVSISTLIGIIFGLWPAMRAANKDPIEALRYE